MSENPTPAAQAAPPAADLAAIAASTNAINFVTRSAARDQADYQELSRQVAEVLAERDRAVTAQAYRQATADLAAIAARTDVSALLARVAELEKAAAEARAALGSICHDLEDPGTAALGALYLLTQATLWTEQGTDFAALALAQHDAKLRDRITELEEERDDARAEALTEAREIALSEAKRLDAEMSGDAGYGARAVARLLRATAEADSAAPLPGSPAEPYRPADVPAALRRLATEATDRTAEQAEQLLTAAASVDDEPDTAPYLDALRLVHEDMNRARLAGDEWAMEWMGDVWNELPLTVRAAAGDQDATGELADAEAGEGQ